MSKRALLPVLMISLLLSACGTSAAEAERRLEAQRDALAAGTMSFTAFITAQPPSGEVFACVLTCSATPEETVVTVQKPEAVSGISATARRGETALRYGEVLLALGPEEAQADSPIGATVLLAEALRSGHIVRCWTERAGDALLFAAELYVDDAHGLTVWFDADTLVPRHASLLRGGAELLRCELQGYSSLG